MIQTGLDPRGNSPWRVKKMQVNSGIVEPAVVGIGHMTTVTATCENHT